MTKNLIFTPWVLERKKRESKELTIHQIRGIIGDKIRTRLEEFKKNKSRYPQIFRKISKKMLKNGVCNDCNTRNYLTVHHIDKNKYNNLITNLVVLCWDCHSKYHNHMHKRPKWLKK